MSKHVPSQADYLDNNSVQMGVFPPAPVATTKQSSMSDPYDHMMQSNAPGGYGMPSGPMAANSLLGGAFGASF
jgi:hypothetical protein